MRAKIRIDPENELGRIDEMVYGVNIEHLERMVYGGYWAELIRNRKFAGHDDARGGRGEPESWRREFVDRQDFGVAAQWDPYGAGAAVEFAHDNTVFYSGQQSQRIDLLIDDGHWHGVAQNQICLTGGVPYHLRAVLRGSGRIREVRFSLGRDCASVQVAGNDLQDRWQTFEFALVPKASGCFDLNVCGTGQGQLWLGAVSLMRRDHQLAGGVRQDAAERLKTAGITHVRWPGGNFASDYHWEHGVGPIDRRPTTFNRAWGEWEPHDFGTDEFLTHCRQWDIIPFVTVNAGSGTPGEAAAWVEYCNGDPDSKYGALRAANGHYEPYRVRHWSIGNELWGNFQVGHVDAETYARRCIEFARAMRTADPSIHLTAVGHVRNTLGRWNERVARAVGAEVDAIAIHAYALNPMILASEPDPEDKYLAIVGGADSVASMLDDSIAVIDAHWSGAKPAQISYDEYGVREDLRLSSPWKERYRLRDGICIAGIIMAMQERCQRVRIGAQFAFVNRLGLIDAEADAILESPCYLAFALLANHRGPRAVAATCQVPSFSHDGLATEPPLAHAPWLRVAATASTGGQSIWLEAINRHPSLPIIANVEVAGVGSIARSAQVFELGGSGPLARNEFGAPAEVYSSERSVDLTPVGNSFEHQFPPHSVTVIELSVE